MDVTNPFPNISGLEYFSELELRSKLNNKAIMRQLHDGGFISQPNWQFAFFTDPETLQSVIDRRSRHYVDHSFDPRFIPIERGFDL